MRNETDVNRKPGVTAEAAANARALGRRTSAVAQASADKNAIRPFRVNVSEAELADLHKRIANTRLPERETVSDFSQGVPLATTRELARYRASVLHQNLFEATCN